MPPSSGQTPAPLSSRVTFFFKFLFPTVWIGGFGLGTAALVARPGPDTLEFVVLFVLGSAFLLWECAPLKKVTATTDGLLVSSYRRETLVPYDQIAAVSQTGFLRGRRITVDLRTAGPFGRRFRFMPYLAFVAFGDHPAVVLLLERAEPARRK
jgi:hypothetical protein